MQASYIPSSESPRVWVVTNKIPDLLMVDTLCFHGLLVLFNGDAVIYMCQYIIIIPSFINMHTSLRSEEVIKYVIKISVMWTM